MARYDGLILGSDIRERFLFTWNISKNLEERMEGVSIDEKSRGISHCGIQGFSG